MNAASNEGDRELEEGPRRRRDVVRKKVGLRRLDFGV
jgi:hypothetical protein